MTEGYRLFGAELSPYSVKVRAYLRYKGLPHEWVVRNHETMAEFRSHAKLPLIPLLLKPDGGSQQDSTPIIEALEAEYPEPSIHPDDPVAAFVSVLLEEYGDEWVNKPMFHYRWHYEADRIATSERLAVSNLGASGDALAAAAAQVRERMVGRLHFVGSSAENAPVIEGSLHRLLDLLVAHLTDRAYLFGGRPAFGDFGLGAEIYECPVDPTAGALLRDRAPLTLAWCERLMDPRIEGPFEAWPALAPTLLPVLKGEVAGIFFPWTTANAAAVQAGAETLEVEIDGKPFSQTPQKYHARSLAALKAKYAALADRAAIDAALADTGCLAYLRDGG